MNVTLFGKKQRVGFLGETGKLNKSLIEEDVVYTQIKTKSGKKFNIKETKKGFYVEILK